MNVRIKRTNIAYDCVRTGEANERTSETNVPRAQLRANERFKYEGRMGEANKRTSETNVPRARLRTNERFKYEAQGEW